MAEEKIIHIRVDAEPAIKRFIEIQKAIEENTKAISELDKESTDYARNLAILTAKQKAYKDEMRTLGNEIKNVIKQENDQLGYMQKLEAEVSVLTTKYKALNEAELNSAKGKTALENLTKKREELSQLNQAYGNHTMEVGKYGKATASLNLQMAHLLREAPNFAISARIGIMSLTNNLPYFVDAVKTTKAELAALKAQGEKVPSMFSTLTKSLFSFNFVVMAGITLMQLFGEDLINWIGSLFKGKEAVEKLTESQMGLLTTQQTLKKSMEDGGEYKTAVANIEKLSTTLKAAKGNTELQKAAVDEYNKTLGTTFGKVKDVDSALQLINENKDAYISAMKDMAFANAFFAQSAEDATKAMEVGLKTNAELVGESSEYYIEEIAKVDKIATSTKRRLNELISGGATEQQIKVQTDLVAEYEKKQADIRTAYNNAAAKEREKQIKLIQQHQNKSLEEATKYYNQYATKFKEHNWLAEDSEDKKREKKKETFDFEQKLQDARAKGVEDDMLREMAVVIANEQKKQTELKEAFAKQLVTQAQYNELSIAYEDERTRLLSDITDKYVKKETDKIKKMFEDDKKNRDENTRKALEENEKKLQADVQNARNRLDTAILNNNETLQLKLDVLNKEKELEVTQAIEKGESVKAINDYYAAKEKDLRLKNTQEKINETIEYGRAVADIMQGASDFSSALADAELQRWAKANKGKIGFEEEYAKKKAKLEHQAAVRNKVLQTVNSIINTAAAVVELLATPPLAIAAGIAGALQTAAIIAAPIPDENATSAGGGGSQTQTTTVTEKFHTGTNRPATKAEERELTATLLTTERVLSPQQTSIFDNITNRISSMGGADNVVGGVGGSGLNQAQIMEAAVSRALKNQKAPVVIWKDKVDFEDKMARFEQNRTL